MMISLANNAGEYIYIFFFSFFFFNCLCWAEIIFTGIVTILTLRFWNKAKLSLLYKVFEN